MEKFGDIYAASNKQTFNLVNLENACWVHFNGILDMWRKMCYTLEKITLTGERRTHIKSLFFLVLSGAKLKLN